MICRFLILNAKHLVYLFFIMVHKIKLSCRNIAMVHEYSYTVYCESSWLAIFIHQPSVRSLFQTLSTRMSHCMTENITRFTPNL